MSSFLPTRRLALAPLLILVAGTANAQGDPEVGQDLALQWCTSCHVVEREGQGTDAAPPLPPLLQEERRTPDQLRGWLSDPHPPMPNLDLTRQEIEHIVAYLQSLASE